MDGRVESTRQVDYPLIIAIACVILCTMLCYAVLCDAVLPTCDVMLCCPCLP
jgi:hypothetical protein